MPTGTGGMRSTRALRVALADGDSTARAALLAQLTTLSDIEIVATASNASDAVIDAWRHRPDVALLDLALPGIPVAEATRHILRAAPGSAVCVLVGSESDRGVSAALDAGAREALVKTASPEQIHNVLTRVRRA